VIRIGTHDIGHLARRLAALPPAPEGWLVAAQELPQMRRNLDDLLTQAESDAGLRDRLVANLESALAESGIRPTPRIVHEARTRLHAP
jgi:hypothetical protein